MKNNPDKTDLETLARQCGARHIPFHSSTKAHWQSPPALQAIEAQLTQALHLRSVLLVTGANGVGKSALVGRWLEGLDTRRYLTLVVTQATLSGSSLLSLLTHKLGKSPSGRRDRNLQRIEEALTELEQQTPLIVLDEAQHYSCAALEEVRLLLGLNLATQPVFALTMISDDYFLKTLGMRHHRALYSRIAYHLSLQPWSRKTIDAYLTQSLKTAGLGHFDIEPAAVDLLASASAGLPRCLSQLARTAWIHTVQQSATTLSPDHVQEAMKTIPYLPGNQLPPIPPTEEP